MKQTSTTSAAAIASTAEENLAFEQRLAAAVALDDRPFDGTAVDESALWRARFPWPTPGRESPQ